MKKYLIGFYMLAASLHSAPIYFKSEEALKRAFYPHAQEEVVKRCSNAGLSVELKLDPNLREKKVILLRNRGCGNVLHEKVYTTENFTVYYPESPRVPHHLAIGLNRKNVKGIADLTEKENSELFDIIKKMAEIYKQVFLIQGFVVAQYDKPQDGHQRAFVVEVIPHLPGFGDVKNIVDKVNCNHYMLFRSANLSAVRLLPMKSEADNWKREFMKKHDPLSPDDYIISLPYRRKESHLDEANQLLYRHFLEWCENKGAGMSENISSTVMMPLDMPLNVKTVEVKECFFCKPEVINKQLVYEYENTYIFYNIRKCTDESKAFLILPKRHVSKVYGLTDKEISNIGIVRSALVEVLNEMFPKFEVISYIQDSPSTGQTVFHSHEQVVVLDPNTVPLSWTLMSFSPTNVSEEEMKKNCREFGEQMDQKIHEIETRRKHVA